MTGRHIVAVSWSSGETRTHDCGEDTAKAELLASQAHVLSRSTPAAARALGLPGVPTRVLTLTEYGDDGPDGYCTCDDGPPGSAPDCGVRRHREAARAARR